MATNEDGLGLFDVCYGDGASPFKEGDESSVDIYDGLDNDLTVPEESAPNSTPAENSLNLFDEILIEEGTAKEASYHELQAEYGKCQQQMKELMKKFKEIQAQNVILQNENQALKKNISALIKTARVEINRKDEEISNLHQRLSEFPSHRSSFTRTYLPGSTNGRCSEMCKTKDSNFRPSDSGDSIKMEHRMKNECSKDTYHSHSSRSTDSGKSSSEKRNTPNLPTCPPEELCNGGPQMCLPNYDHSSHKDNRKERKEIKSNEQYSRGTDKYKREVHQSTGNKVTTCSNGDGEEGNSDPQQKLKTLSEKASKKELQEKSQSIRHKCSPSAERRAERGVSSWEKQTAGKDRFQTKDELYADERSQNVLKKDDKTHDKDEKNAGQKNKLNEKLQEQPRRSGRRSSPHSKNEHSKSLHESRECRVEESRKGKDINCKRDRGTNDHTSREGRTSPSNSSSREHKYARLKENSSRYEWETAHSKSERHRTEEKRKRENQDDNKHFRNERKVAKEISHQSAKESKRDKDVTKSEKKKFRAADSLKVPKTKDDHVGTKSKDLKLSFMEKLNLTLSPGKKQCPTDRLITPSQKATDEGSTELTLQAELLDSAQPVNCGLTEQTSSMLQVLDSAAQSNMEPVLPVSASCENEALKAAAAAADPAQPEVLSVVTTDELSSETSPEAEVSQVQLQALPGAAEVLVPDEVQAETLSETLSEAAETGDLVELEVSATAVAETGPSHPESLLLEVTGSVPECENLPVTVAVMQDVPAAEEAQSEPVSESKGAVSESAAEEKGEDKMWPAADTGSSADQCDSQNLVSDDSEAKSSGALESCDVADYVSETKPDSLMEVVKDSGHLASENVAYPVEEKSNCKINMSTSQSLDRTMLTEKYEPLVDQNACDLEPDLTEISTTSSLSGEMCPRTKERETNPVTVDDDSSILSIDLNHLRHIPKAISPLNSPMRPLAKALKMEGPCKGLVKSYNKDLNPESTVVICPSKNLSKEVNKENQNPVSMSDERLEMESQLSISSDEIEEGEIISSDEEKSKPERGSECTKKSGPKTSPETRNLIHSPQNQKSKTVHCKVDNGKFVSVKVSTQKNRERHKNQTLRSSKDMKKNKTVSIASLEKIVHVIVEPSNVQEVMQMLRAIRKQMRKNYMKFKVHFPVQQFHRIIESGIKNFTSLIKYLNFSKMSTLDETLKLSVCDIIESKLKQVKKNAIVDRLFEQQVSDMKKQLWKFVDEQLDYLFEKIRRMIIKLCDVGITGNDREEGKFKRAGKQKHKMSHKNDLQRSRKKSLKATSQKPEEYILSKQVVDYQQHKGHHGKNKTDAPKPALTKCLNSIDNTRNSQTKVHLSKKNNLQGTLTPLKGVKYEKEAFQLSREANKSDFSFELLTEQQASSLTFNLVSDAQMGEIFKSLLQGSDLLEKNGGNIDRNEWEFRTPEKQVLDSHKCRSHAAELMQEIAAKEACVEPRAVEDMNWPLVSPVRAPSLASRIQMSVDPDVLDESCMFDVPTNAASGKEDEGNLQKTKSSVSSILLEDLAVSLTIPSPLKSDAHLSFLKPENNSSSAPEGVLSAHYSEDALLEEEDATEQDIHLALESDNSSSKSSCSSSWTSRPVAPGFQCRPSLPMQAVIMEKSNDHFIVKIRRAVPSTSPASDQVASGKETRASSTKMEKAEMRSGEKERGSQRVTAATVQETVKPDGVKTNQLPRVITGQDQNPALPQPLNESDNSIGKEEATGLLGPCRKSSNIESHNTESPGEGSEQSQAHRLKVSENINEMDVRSQASFPAGCSIESYIDLTDDVVSETSCCVVESTAGNRTQDISTGNSEMSDRKEELEECAAVTEELSNGVVAGGCTLETKSTSNTDVGCHISIDDKTSKKRKKEALRENSNSKRQRKEAEDEQSDVSDAKSEEVNSSPKQCSSKKNELQQNKDSSPLASTASSPSLYAKNIIKKKGEVVVSWTRNDDREILLECQRKGPSSKTFVSLATRLNKSPNRVLERFKQLMKLFKKSKCK